MSLLGGGGRGSKQIKPMSFYILFFWMASLSQFIIHCLNFRSSAPLYKPLQSPANHKGQFVVRNSAKTTPVITRH